MGYKLADGTDSEQYKVGDGFVVVENTGFFEAGDIITLEENDGSELPYFSGDSPTHWSRLKSLTPADKKRRKVRYITTEQDVSNADVVIINGVVFFKEG